MLISGHMANASVSILVTVLGMIMEVSDVHP